MSTGFVDHLVEAVCCFHRLSTPNPQVVDLVEHLFERNVTESCHVDNLWTGAVDNPSQVIMTVRMSHSQWQDQTVRLFCMILRDGEGAGGGGSCAAWRMTGA